MDFLDHSSSSTLTIPIVPLNMSAEILTTGSGMNSVWSWSKTNGELRISCPGSRTYSYGVACSWKEVTWGLKYTKNISWDGESSGPRMIPWAKASIKFDDLWQHLASQTQTERECERICGSITPDLLRPPQRTSKWNLIIRSMDYSCGLLLRCVIIIAATPVHFPNTMVGSQPWLEHTGSTDQECDGGIEQVPVCFESSWFHKRCCRNVYGIKEDDQRGNWTLTSMHGCYLIQNSCSKWRIFMHRHRL